MLHQVAASLLAFVPFAHDHATDSTALPGDLGAPGAPARPWPACDCSCPGWIENAVFTEPSERVPDRGRLQRRSGRAFSRGGAQWRHHRIRDLKRTGCCRASRFPRGDPAPRRGPGASRSRTAWRFAAMICTSPRGRGSLLFRITLGGSAHSACSSTTCRATRTTTPAPLRLPPMAASTSRRAPTATSAWKTTRGLRRSFATPRTGGKAGSSPRGSATQAGWPLTAREDSGRW